MGAELLLEAIMGIEAGVLSREKQRAEEATLAPILKKEDGLVDWRLSAQEVYNRWRGFNPWPGVYTFFRGQQMSIARAQVVKRGSGASGRIWAEKRQVFVSCGGTTTLELLDVQLPGRKRMGADAFLNGYHLTENEMLGEKP